MDGGARFKLSVQDILDAVKDAEVPMADARSGRVTNLHRMAALEAPIPSLLMVFY